MSASTARADGFVTARWFPVLAVILMAVRFVGPSAAASLSIAGFDVAGVNAFLLVYGDLLPLAAMLFATALLLGWPRGFRWDRSLIPTVVLLAWDLGFFLGEIDPGYRLLSGPLASLPLAMGVAATVMAYGWVLDVRMRRSTTGTTSRDGFRALYVGFTAAYFFGSLRFIDYRTAFGSAAPTGWLWFVNYAPTLLLGAISIYFWAVVTLLPGIRLPGALRTTVLPLLGVVCGSLVAQGLGGFILSNILAWGGAYEVFVPTYVSLSFVGFAVGAFIATAWTLRGRLPAPAWWFIIAGVSVTAFAGIQPFGGTLASLAGILLGLTLTARGLLEIAPATSGAPGGSTGTP